MQQLALTPEEQVLSEALQAQMQARAHQQPYWFADFMQDALYTPTLGYYQNTKEKFGPTGDFVTAPSLSRLFGQTLAKQCALIFETGVPGQVLEFGGGGGHLASDILNALDTQITAYHIIEISQSLQARQYAYLKQHCPEGLHKVTWHQSLPAQFKGVVLANEVLDAMPVHRFQKTQTGIKAQCVNYDNECWQTAWQDAPEAVIQAVAQIEKDLPEPLPTGYVSEVNLWLKPWIKSLSDMLHQGVILLFDYGYPRTVYYHATRHMGTLMCHYHHHSHDDPLFGIGVQDLTAHVDFTAVAEAASDAQLDVLGYTHQSAFLTSLGILDTVTENSQGLQTLISPAEMGEIFKVMCLGRGAQPLLGFGSLDDRCRL